MSQYKLHERLQVPVVKIFYSRTREERITVNVTTHTGTQSSLRHFPTPEFSRIQSFLHRNPLPVLACLAYALFSLVATRTLSTFFHIHLLIHFLLNQCSKSAGALLMSRSTDAFSPPISLYPCLVCVLLQ